MIWFCDSRVSTIERLNGTFILVVPLLHAPLDAQRSTSCLLSHLPPHPMVGKRRARGVHPPGGGSTPLAPCMLRVLRLVPPARICRMAHPAPGLSIHARPVRTKPRTDKKRRNLSLLKTRNLFPRFKVRLLHDEPNNPENNILRTPK